MSTAERARLWAQSDPEEQNRDQLREWIEAGDEERLRASFDHPLRFGTAGLRGTLGPGPGHMNRALVRRVSAALAEDRRPAGAGPRVVIGGDARHGSKEFVEDASRVFASAGWTVERFEEPVPTPLLAFAVTHLQADLGVMVTASHNPPEYNGYKVYGRDGAQILPEVADSVAAAFDALDATPEPSVELASIPCASPGVVEDYLDAIHAGLHAPELPRELRVVYTPMHGVGGALTLRALQRHPALTLLPVQAQLAPDADFPTVRFPNPEEEGALDLALEQAAREQADLILAHDPDADRLAVAVRAAEGEMRALNGNELGAVLGDYLLECDGGADGLALVMTTVVSSRLLSRIAGERGALYDECLTGFKWIAHRAREREEAEGVRFLFGYEEALGYTVGRTVGDKDGIGTALHVLELASVEKTRGRTLLDRLDDIQSRHGWHRSHLLTLELPGSKGQARIASILEQLRARPPRQVGGLDVRACHDYAQGFGGLPPTNLLAFDLDGGRMLARPSGTEPKLKFYLELWSAGEAPDSLDAKLHAMADALQEEFG